MIYLEEKTSVLSSLVENQFPFYVQQNSEKFIKFLTSYYESLETKYQPIDIASNLIEYYNVGYFRPNQLIASTKLTDELLKCETEVEVDSTVGFPETNGYIRINGEIIFYRSKTDTSFKECVRGTTALVLESIPKSEVVLTSSIEKDHAVNSVVENLAYNYASEFFTRIKKEIAPLIPTNLVEELNISAFLEKVKSFYSAKGSLNGHRILFKILFNDRKFNITLKNRGTGGKIKVNNYGGSIPDPVLFGGVKPQILDGGSGYDNRKDINGNLITPPIVDIYGTGTGQIKNGLRLNESAIISVTDIDSNGSIIDIEVDDVGSNYTGQITAKVRPANFEQDQIVYSVSGRGSGRVDYFDPNTNELILYDVVGYFAPKEELYTEEGEKARGFIAQSFIAPVAGRDAVTVLSEKQNIEFPREYTFKTSDAEYFNKEVIRLKLFEGYFLENDKLPNEIVFIQEQDKKFGVKGVKIEADNYVLLDNNVFEFEVSSNSDLNDIYLPPSTNITKTVNGITNTSHINGELVITVDDASRFPLTNGIIFVNGKEIEYKSRSFNQFFNCKYTGVVVSTPKTYNLVVTASSFSDYTVCGSDRTGNINRLDPDLTFYEGDTINFKVSADNHPFYLKTVQGVQISGVTNQGTTSGTVSWNTVGVAPGTYYYQCGNHLDMQGKITIESAAGGVGDPFNVDVADEVICFGRRILTSEIGENNTELYEWQSGLKVKKGEFRFYYDSVNDRDNLYVAESTGVTGTVAPTHTEGTKSDGRFAGGDQDEILWKYYSTNRFYYSMYIDTNNILENPKFQIIGMPGEPVIDQIGALHTKSKFEFARHDDPNIKVYNFTTSEISDRLSAVLGTNYNRTRESVLESQTNTSTEIANIKDLPSYQSLAGFTTQHDFQDYIYVVSSGIPNWWKDIVDLNKTLTDEEKKKVAFTNQKLLTRWRKTSLISETQAFGTQDKTKQSIGLNIDGIQVNSYKGNVVEYGSVDKLIIANGGDYPVPYKPGIAPFGESLGFDSTKYPDIRIQDPQDLTTTKLIPGESSFALSSSIIDVDFTTLRQEWSLATDALTGYKKRPTIRVTNQNPAYILSVNINGNFSSVIEEVSGVWQIISTNHKFETTDKVTYFSPLQKQFIYFDHNEEFFVRKINDDRISLFRTKSDCLLNRNPLKLDPIDQSIPINFDLIGEVKNPADFEEAKLELSYANGIIDNIIVINSGKGYITEPLIEILSAEKGNYAIPLAVNDKRVIEMRGSLVSSENYNLSNSNEVTTIPTSISSDIWESRPSVSFDNGSGAEAVAYVANGKISSVVILKRGSNYSLPPKVEIYSDDGGKDGVIEAVLNSQGQIDEFKIVNPGSGYKNSPVLIIKPDGDGGTLSVRLKEWTFNLVRQLNYKDRVDSYGGYVYDEGDKTFIASNGAADASNPKKFEIIDYDLNFPEDLDRRQYKLFTTSKKLLLQYTRVKDVALVDYVNREAIKNGRDIIQNPLSQQEVLVALLSLTDQEVLENSGHSPAILVSYDGIPVYGGLHALKRRNVPVITNPRDQNNPLETSQTFKDQFEEIESRYRLKRELAIDQNNPPPNAVQATDPDTGTLKWFVPVRDGGPSLSDYPIGSFIEDYVYDAGENYTHQPAGLNDLDMHNGRFGITPEFPGGRYCYFNTYKSFDDFTNQVIGETNIDSGFPYVIGDTFASTPADNYMNNLCRTNDKVPSVFTRIFEKEVDPVISDGSPLFEPAPRGAIVFPGIPYNKEYPQEKIGLQRTIAEIDSVSTGTVDSIIIEAAGDDYQVGDKLDIDNDLTAGSGFSGFVSKVVGEKITLIEKSGDYKTVTFTTESNHGLKLGDYVYFDYKTPLTNPVINLHENTAGGPVDTTIITPITEAEIVLGSSDTVNTYKDKELYNIDLNFKYVYKLNYKQGEDFIFSYDIDRVNEFFVLNENNSPADPPAGDSIVLDCNLIPNRLYLHIGNRIYQINKSKNFFGPRKVVSIDNVEKKFTVVFPESTETYKSENLFYSAKALGASGPIADISISQKGYNYKKLPSIKGLIKRGTVDTVAGDGNAILQPDSKTIGRINRIKYDSLGGGFTSNINVNYYLNVPLTGKIINNFEIYDVEIVEGGENYSIIDKIVVKEDGNIKDTDIRASVNLGRITKITIIDGGSNFSKTPTIEVVSPQGQGAVLKAKIRRKKLYPDTIITTNINSILFPVGVTGNVVNFDEGTSTIEYNEKTGTFKENDIIYTDNGKPYGRIVSIKKTRAYAKVKPYATLKAPRKDVTGNLSENLQRITDSNYYQDWSYTIASSRDTIEWKYEQDINTHPAGFKQFGKKLIERRKFFFDNPSNVFNGSVIFTTKIIAEISLKLKESKCAEQIIALVNVGDFEVGDYIFGSTSESVGQVIEKTNFTLKVRLLNDTKFEIGELITVVPTNFSFGIETATLRSVVFLNGIMQEPDLSYESSFKYTDQNGNQLSTPVVDSLLPKFPVETTDELLHYKLPNNLTPLDAVELNELSNLYFPSVDGSGLDITSDFLNNTIISIAGIIQNPATMTLNDAENYITFNEFSGFNSRLFGFTSTDLNRLTFTGNTSGTVFTINETPSDDCQLLIFYSGVNQSQLVTDFTVSGNTITFSETVELNNIFGWYIDGAVECEPVNVTDLLNNLVTGTWDCETKQFVEHIHSSGDKTPTSLYEIRKEYLDGTIYQDNDNETLYGFNTKFTYTTPEYSRSFVEVLDTIKFDGSTKSFKLTSINGNLYDPDSGKDSLMVYINNEVLDISEYSITGNTIYFNKVYTVNDKCTVIDFSSNYYANDAGEGARDLDRLEVQHNGIRRRFNLSDRGVPQYTKNVGDVFAVRNGVFQRPDQRHQTLDANKITFNDAPKFEDTTDLIWFNRQFLPLPTKNVVLDDFYCFDGERTHFPITIDGINFYPINVYHLFIVRNGVYQKHGIDYRLGTPSDVITPPGGIESYTLDGSHVIFASAPQKDDQITAFYSYDGLNQNIKLDSLKYFNGVETTFPLTRDFISKTPYSVDHIQVYRNGVYQHSDGIDYRVETTNGGPRIVFTTPPEENEDIFVTEFDTSVNFINKTTDFTQVSPQVIHNNSLVQIGTSDTVLIYRQGLLISEGWTIDYVNQDITFDEAFDLSGRVKIFVVSGSLGELDKVFKFDGVETTFPLTKDYVSRAPLSANHIQVYRNGVYQYSGTDYTVNNASITFTTAPTTTDRIFVTNFSGNSKFEDATGSFTQTSPTEYQHTGPLGQNNFLLIFIDGIVQVGNSFTYNSGTNTLTFSAPITGQNVVIYKVGTQVTEHDGFFVMDGVNTTFPLTHFLNTSSVTSAANIQVYRNGVYQYETGDYTITSSANGNKYINFATAPTTSDDIFITDVTNTANFEDITNNFVQVNANTLGNITTLDPSKTLLIYNQGILQRFDSYTYDYVNEQLQFTENFTLNNLVKVFTVSNGIGILDSPHQIDGVATDFPLTYNNQSVTPASDFHIQVYRNGVYQYPTVDYTVTNNRISFATAPQTTDDIFIKMFDGQELIDLTADISQSTATDLVYSGPENISNGIILIHLNGLIQVGNSYTVSGNTISFSQSVDLVNDQISFLYVRDSFKIDDPRFFDGTATRFALTKNNISINTSTASNSFVYRNGVFQNPSVDYVIQGQTIDFTTAPQSTDTVFIQHFDGSGLNDLTASFTSISSTEYQYNATLDTRYPLVVFHGGIMQVRNSWQYDENTQRLVFSEPVTNPLHVYQLQDCVVLVNSIVTESGTTRYALKNGRKSYVPSSPESLFVCVDGIVQKPGISYTVEGSDLVFLDNTLADGVPLFVVDASLLGLQSLDELETAWEEGDRKYIRLLNNYVSFTSDSFFVVKDAVVQNTAAYEISNNVFSIIDEPESSWSDIHIYNCVDSGLQSLNSLGTVLEQTSQYTDLLLTSNYTTVGNPQNQLLVSIDGIVQEPGFGYTTYGQTNQIIRINSSNIDFDKLEIIDFAPCNVQLLDNLNDLVDTYVDSDGLTHTLYHLRNYNNLIVDTNDAFVVYGSIVQNPGVDYTVQNSIIEFLTNGTQNLSELHVYDFSNTDFEVIDNLESFISENNGIYRWRITKDYQTLFGITEEQLMVQINGVVQYISNYTLNGSTISLDSPNYESAKIYDFTGSNFRLLDNPSEDFSTNKYRAQVNYASFTPTNVVDVFLLRDQVLQNPTEDYTIGSGYIEYTTNITKETELFILYTHNSEEIIPIVEIPYNVCTGVQDTYTLPTVLTQDEKERSILYLNGVPNFYGVDFDIVGTTLSFFGGAFVDEGSIPFIIKYTNLTMIDDLENCPDGTETRFKLLYKGQNILASSSADILTSRSGIIQNPDVDYTVTLNSGYATFINFVTPLPEEHNTFMVRMYDNRTVNLTAVNSTTYTINSSVTDTDNIYVFANGNWMLPTKDYTISNNQIVLQIPGVDVFAIEFTGIVKLLDEVHTPYDGSRKLFNLFLTEENFVPAPTVENDVIADESSILVVKNGFVLDPKVDYTLNGDIRSQINFTVAPVDTDVIYVKAVGSMIKLDSITSGFTGSENTYYLTNSTQVYYPNAEIERPREHENQIIVIKDSLIQSPVYDYYIDNNKLVFNQNVSSSTSKIVVLDFRGCKDDVRVDNRMYQTKVGDKVHLDCSIDEERTFVIDRTVTEVISPTVLKTSPTSNNVYNGFSGTATYADGKVIDISVQNGGVGYDYPPVLRTLGSGGSAFAAPNVDPYPGGEILSSTALSSSATYTGTTTTIAEVYNSLPVRGLLYVPTTNETSLNVIVLFHGTIDSPGQTPATAAANSLNAVLDSSNLNLGNNIIFSVAYPQDAIPGWTQQQAETLFPGIILSKLLFGENINYAEAALLWAKDLLDEHLETNGTGKTINKIYTFGHSQGGSIAHRLNTRITVDGVICNAPGPIDLTTRCINNELYGEGSGSNVSCDKIKDAYGSAQTDPDKYDGVSLKSYLTQPVSPVLYTQCFDDDEYQTSSMQNILQKGMLDYDNVTFKYYEFGGHAGFNYNKAMQRDIREFIEFGKIGLNLIKVQNPGYNIYVDQKVVPTVYGFTYRQQQLSVSNMTLATALTSNISDTVEIIPVKGTGIFDVNPPVITVTADTGSGAIIRPYVINGYLRKVEILSGGSGYDERTLQVIVSGGGGSGAVLEPFLDANGTLIDLKIRDHGIGYDSYRAYINMEAIEYTDKTATELIGVTRNVMNYDLGPWEFPLVKNEAFITVHSVNHLQVFRNGVLQTPDIDFELAPINANCTKIFFKTPIADDDDVFITHFDSASDFENISNNFTQLSASEVQYNGTLSYNHLLISIDGVIQLNTSWTFDSNTNVLTFDEPVNISSQKVLIYKISTAVNTLNEITMVSGTNTYTLSASVTSAESVMVIMDGVVQEPFKSYSVSGNTITFSNVYDGSKVNIFDFASVNYRILDDINVSRWINTSTCAIGHKQDDRVYSGKYL